MVDSLTNYKVAPLLRPRQAFRSTDWQSWLLGNVLRLTEREVFVTVLHISAGGWWAVAVGNCAAFGTDCVILNVCVRKGGMLSLVG